MRPLRLTLRAFGSFPGEEVIDFEALVPLGLFVVAGPTGSGKSTIFDALVFALYGSVPGRRQANEMRSDHAPAGAVPEVVLEFEARGRRYRATRSPGYERPKHRGGGVTAVPPTARLEVRRDGVWVPLSSGLSDVRAQVIECVGLTVEQFQRVILLPQGEFEQFLVARGDERKPLLRQLFGSGVFDRAVTKLKDAANDATRTADAVCAAVERYRFAASEQLTAAEGRSAIEPADIERLDDRLAVVERAVSSAAADWQAAERSADAAGAAAAAAHDIARRWQLRADRRARAASLDAERPAREAERCRLADARRSLPVVRALSSLDAAGRVLADASATRERADRSALETLAPLALDDGLDDIVSLRRRLHADAVRAAQLVDLRREWQRVVAVRTSSEEHEAAATRAWAAASEKLAVCETTVARQGVELAGLARANELLQGAEVTAAAATTVLERRRELQRAVDLLDQLHLRAAEARAAYDDVVGEYLAAAAPRLAERLRDGEPCPVCGSPEHPSPSVAPDPAAAVSAGSVSASAVSAGSVSILAVSASAPSSAGHRVAVSIGDVDASRERSECASTERDRQLGTVESIRALLGSDAERPVGELAEVAAATLTELDVAKAAVARRVVLEAATAELAARREAAVIDERRAADAAATATAQLVGAVTELRRLEESLAGCDCPHEDPVSWQRQSTIALAALDERDEAVVAERESATRVTVLRGAADEAFAASGFADATEARSAAIDDDELDAGERRLAEWDDAVRDLAAVLNEREPDLPERVPDTDEIDACAARARAVCQALSAEHAAVAVHASSAAASIAAVGSRQAELDAAIRAAEVATTVLDRCAGRMMPRIALESWVLGVELERVAEAANVHLTAMTSGRYRLQRATSSFDARSGAGLDLEVADAHTGTTRRTTSLSGGERFQASLSLALGLADVVTSGAAATCRTLDALFVDEGFGSLDADALDQAIAALDRLRYHGRQIGVITHVETMKAALTVGIEVRPLPGNGGSTIRQPVLAR
ncbi:MAG: AAA family ATPase [Acidimicrobiia bacterium]